MEKELAPIRETKEDFDGVEAQILKIFRQEIYLPIIKELGIYLRAPKDVIANARKGDTLEDAIRSGRIHYSGGKFLGKFSAGVSKELRELGAAWDRKSQSYVLSPSKIPATLKSLVQVSDGRFKRALEAIDRKLGEILPKQISENVKIAHFFDRTLHRIDQDFEKQVRGITVVPKLTPEVRKAVADGYTLDLQRYIQDFTEKEIGRLRTQVQGNALSGRRYEALVGDIQASYGVSERKAKFLARQETALMMAAFKKARYQEAGSRKYRWQCVVGSPKHPVRPAHQRLNGKVFSWDSPPITDEKGNRNNPGQDYNCRCVARPIVNFAEK